MWTANVQMMMMYYHIGQHILNSQKAKGWGARIVDRRTNCATQRCTIVMAAQHHPHGESKRA